MVNDFTDVWIIRNQMTDEVFCYLSREKATDAASRKNRANEDHPSFDLWYFNGKRTKYEGFLYREPGEDFDRNDCRATYA